MPKKKNARDATACETLQKIHAFDDDSSFL
jgi:hypothetical protein